MKDVIVLDIGTQFIKAAISGNDKFFVQETCTNDILLSCKKAIKKLQKKSKTKTRNILLGLNNDVLKGKATTICFKRDNPRGQIELVELKNWIQKIEWKALDNIRQEFLKETEIKNSDIKLFHAHLIDIKVDGQVNLSPVGVPGENICISVYNTYNSFKKISDLEKIISELKMNLIEMIPIPFAIFKCLYQKNLQKGDTLIIDTGAKVTEVTLVKNGGEAIETKSFHLGGRTFSRVLAEFLNSKGESGEMVKIKYSNNEISSEVKKKIEKILEPSVAMWLNGIKIILNDFSKNYKLSLDRIYICGNGSKLPLIKSRIKKELGIKIFDAGEEDNSAESSCLALKKFCAGLPDEKDIFLPIFKRVIKLIQN